MARGFETTQYQSSNRSRYGISFAALAFFLSAPAIAQSAPDQPPAPETVAADAAGPSADDQQPPAVPPALQPGDRVTVTARRIEEDVQDVPIPVAVLTEDFLADSGAYNAGKLAQAVPSVQFYSTNPRNSAINIRSHGAPFGLTNDGIEQGVGLYVDGVYFARPASATLDFLDVAQIEVLRGLQGTLYGKNTTAGAINVTTKAPEFDPSTDIELSFGNYGFVQFKATTTGPITGALAYRLSFSGTQRDGEFFIAADVSCRSDSSSSPTASSYLNIITYTLINARAGFRGGDGWDVFVWGRNLADEEYFEILSAGGSSSGCYAGLPGDPRTRGVTLRGIF